MKKHVLILISLFCAIAQGDHTLSGFIYDKSNKESLIGVNIYIEKLNIGNITNTDGYYVITDVPSGKHTIVINYIGYKIVRRQITFNEKTDVKRNFNLFSDAISGDVVNVVANKDKKKIDLMYDAPVSKVEMTASMLQRIPQVVEADLLRSLQTLPGVVAVSDFSSAIYVRGGTPDQNLYLVDGADVYNPEHAFGLFSTFNTDAIKKAELLKGGYTAEYGTRLSSVLDVINLDGNREKFEGSASLSVLSAKTTLQFPLGKKGALSTSFRRTYFDKVLDGAIPELPDYYFYDGNYC